MRTRLLSVAIMCRDELCEPAILNFYKLTENGNPCNKCVLIDLAHNEFCSSVLTL